MHHPHHPHHHHHHQRLATMHVADSSELLACLAQFQLQQQQQHTQQQLKQCSGIAELEFIRLCGVHHSKLIDGSCRLIMVGMIQGQSV
jgi:hypothetical protein